MARKNVIRIVVIVMSVLLAISVLSLVGVVVYGQFKDRAMGSSKAPGNELHPQLTATRMMATRMPMSSVSFMSQTGTAAIGSGVTVVATDATTNADIPSDVTGEAYGIFLHKKNAGDNVAFRMPNMFPGDSETKYYGVEISYRNEVTVRFTIDIDEGCEKMAEVLKCKIVLLTTGEELYDGLMRDVPESLNHTISSEKATTDELYYGITAYLDTSVGNEYQGVSLTADFRWWVDEVENLEPAPPTGDNIVIAVVSVSAVLLLLLIVMMRRRRKKYEYD